MATADPKPGTCMVRIYEDSPWSYHGRPKFCGRPIKNPVTELCGVHQRSVDLAAEKEAARKARNRKGRALSDRLGIYVAPLSVGALQGMVACYPGALEKLADKLEALEAQLEQLKREVAR